MTFFYGHGSSVHVAMPRMPRRRVKQRKTLPQTQNYSHIQQAEVQFHHGSNMCESIMRFCCPSFPSFVSSSGGNAPFSAEFPSFTDNIPSLPRNCSLTGSDTRVKILESDVPATIFYYRRQYPSTTTGWLVNKGTLLVKP